MTLETLVERHGLPALFLVAIGEGDLSLVVAGMLAHLGLMPFAGSVLAGALGNLTGDALWYAMGRFQRERIRKSQLYRRAGPRIEGLARRLGPWELLAARVVYGTRNVSMLFWGLLPLPFGRFLALDALGCLLAGVGFVGLGYLAGQGTASLLGGVRRVEHWLVLAIGVGAAALWLARRLVWRGPDGGSDPEGG